jgi:hypothetical protein
MNADYFDALAFAMKVEQARNNNRLFLKSKIKHNLTTAQKIIAIMFLINLENITDI